MTTTNGVRKSTATLSAISVSLTVAGDAEETLIGNPAPTDSSYSASQLTVTVTALPTDGSVTLSNGALVKVGEKLTVAQLTGLEFAPTPGLFSQSSTFTYSVKDPAGVTATGSDTLKIGADTSPPKASSATLTVAANSGATPANILAPTDANFKASQLTVTVTALPTDGRVLLSNGKTAVTVGENLTVAQLTGLEFQPTAGIFGESSTFTYSVKDPAGLTASGSETLKIAADTSPPIATNGALTVAGNGAAAAINIPLPSDPNYTTSQLTVTVTALPTDGAVLLSNGTTAVTVGETLTVAQLTGLEFQPTAGVFGESSTFTYSVKDPAGLTAIGSETLKTAADISPPVAINGTLTVAENGAATSIGIPAPSDPNYAASQLTVTVTALPTDGTVLLSNGTTAVTVGEALTVAQLTGLEFQATAGVFGQNSTFTYSVEDPVGLSAAGSEVLAIGPDTEAPTTTDPTLTVAENGAATSIGIPAPSDPNYAASQLTVTVTALPTDGTVLLSNGTTAVTVGEALTVAQLTGLEFQPTAEVFGQSSSFNYSVEDPAGLTASGSEILAIGSGTGISPDGTTLMEGSTGSLVTSAGTWTFGSTVLSSGEAILLNGQQAGGWGAELLVANQGNLYTENNQGSWYEWSGAGWSQTTNPSGTSSADTSPPVATNGALAVAGNTAATAINIPSPSDPNYSGSQLKVTVTALPTDGTLLLSNGTTAVTAGETLTVAQLTGLDFQPTVGVFGQSSNFTYSVTDPAGLTANGSEMLTIAADTAPPTTTDPILAVAENSAATAINIPSPSDPNYSASQLTVTVTALPTDGTVLLSNGTTAVTAGETLTVAQLTGLAFQPTAGAFGQSSNFTYSVTDPAGLTASGSEILTIGPGTVISPDGTTLMEGSAGGLVTSAGTWTFSTSVGSGGDIILLNGQSTGGGSGSELLVANQGNLYTENTSGNWYEWNGASWSQTTNPTSTSSSTTSSSGLGTVDSTPVIIQPSQPGDIVGLQLQNTGSTAESSGYVTFGEVFKDGAVTPGESLVARINGVNYAVQMDVKTTNTDGSVSDAVLTLDAPTIAANSSLSVMLAQGTASAPSVTAPSPQSLLTSLLAGSDNTTVNFTFNNADGSTTTDSTSAAQALQQALANGTVQTWLSGPEVNQYDVTTTVDNGNLKVEFDIQAYANGTTSTNVIFDNSWMNSPGKTDLNYNVSIGQGGQTVYSANNVEQYLYSLWNYQANSAGTISPNVQYDISYLESTGAIQAYDTSVGVAASTIASYAASLNATNTGPLGTADVTTYMPTTGGRDDIGPQPAWVSEWLLSQSATAEQTMMANADAAGGIPWHFTDESTGEPINPITYSNFWDDPRGYGQGNTEPANGLPDYPSTGAVSADDDPWTPDPAHMPDLNYVPYLITGSPYQLELLQAQADYALNSNNPGYSQALIPGSTIEYGIINTQLQTRAIAWDIRDIAEAAFATPNSDPLKAAFTTELQDTMASMVQQYVVDGADSASGQIQGFINGATQVAPWQQDYIVTSLAEVAGMNIPQASAEAVEMLQFMNNAVAGLFTNAAAGFDPIEGTGYWLNTADPTTGAPYTTWAEFYQGNLASGNIPTPTNVFPNYPTDTQGGYAEIAMAALADEITYTSSPQAIQAYGYVVSQTAYAFAQAGTSEAAAFASNPEWDIMPKLSDGTYLTASQMQIDTSSNNVNLTATGGDSLLSVVGGGTDTLTGGTDAVDLLYGGTGNDTLVAGTGNDYLFGGTGTNTFIDGPGNNYMSSNGTANTYVFNLAKSGSDTIANFNVNTDQLVIASNLNGDGITSVAALIAGATTSNGSTILNLGPHEEITLLNIANPSTLAHAAVIS